jgi:hypothetical protein
MSEHGPPRRCASEAAGGRVRDTDTLSSHLQFGLGDVAFMRASVSLELRAEVQDGHLEVQASVRNVTAGHHIPTGNPMRNMLLLVEAQDARHEPLPLGDGERLPEWAGRGDPRHGNYAGLPGKGFAKVLVDLVEYPANRVQGRRFARAFPTPHWRPSYVLSDTRIPAEATDVSRYRFAIKDKQGSAVVRARLIYRRTYRSWGDLDTIKPGELELASQVLTVIPNRYIAGGLK